MTPPGAGCPDPDALLAFAGGALGPAALAGLEAHLDRCLACRRALSDAIGGARTRGPREASLSPSALGRGDELAGRYRIVRFIARGGMGEVYEAEDLHLDTRVALKVVAPGIAEDAKAIARLRAEVQLARRVTHVNVCRVFDLGASDAGPFLTMELLSGETLGNRVRRDGRLPPAEVAALLPQLAAALDAAHEAGVVHRDLKSDNVMLCPGRAGPRVVVMDFGLARSLLAEPGLASLTTGNVTVGTVAYMAPEQVSGARALGPGVDIYALGVVLFELLTGALPFRGKTPVAVALDRLSRDAPSPRALVPELDPAWERLLARCLAREPAARCARARELVGLAPVPR